MNGDILRRLNSIIEDIRRNPFRGIGKPEPLRDELQGGWSRRITLDHRLVYRIVRRGEEQHVEIAACRYHYERR
jgi:toxin YoeB